jgi:hypothetical protein
MTHPKAAGYLDGAYFFRSIGKPGGFLAVQGWFCVAGQKNLALSADLRVGHSVVRIRCRDLRPDVAAAGAAYSLNSGFNVIIPISTDIHPDLEVTIDFSAGSSSTVASSVGFAGRIGKSSNTPAHCRTCA